MSITTTTRSAGPFAGDGVTVALPFSFKVFAGSDLRMERTSAAGVTTTLAISTHYTVTLNADQDVAPGGVATLLTPLALGESALITSAVPATQPLQLRNGGPFLPRAIEDALDRQIVVLQQLGFSAGQAVRAPFPDVLNVLPSALERAGRVLGFDSLGQPVATIPADGSAAAVVLDLASTGAGKGAAMVGYKAAAGAARTLAERIADGPVSVFDFMTAAQIADVRAGTKTLDVTAPVLAAIAAGKNVYLPAGVYRLSPLALSGVRGLVLQGAGAAMLAGGARYLGNTTLSFDDAPEGTDGLTVSDFTGLQIRDLVVSMRRGAGANGGGGGRAVYLHTGHDYSLHNVKVDVRVGPGGGGVVLGGGNGETATFVGGLTNVKVFSHTSVAIKANFGTSLALAGCYQVGGWFEFSGMTYCSASACASELAPEFYGYVVNGCTNMAFDACGGEQNARGVFYLGDGSSNIVINAPYGAANNTSGNNAVGDLVHLDSSDGQVKNVIVTTPTSVANHASTVASIYGTVGTGRVEVLGEDSALLPRGIGGNASWLTGRLTRRGDREAQAWAPVLQSWATTGGAPAVSGGWIKQGDLVFFWVRVVPGGTVTTTRPASTITGLPFTPSAVSAVQTDDNGASYGGVSIGAGGIIYPQAVSSLAVPVTISGTFYAV